MSNLYEYFGCETKEELYERVKNNDYAVRSLVDFLDYSKLELKGEKYTAITSPDSFVETVLDVRMPTEDEVIAIFLNSKNEPIHLSRMDYDDIDSHTLALKEGLNAGAINTFLLGNNNTQVVQSFFDTFDIGSLDVFHYNAQEHAIRSVRQGSSFPLVEREQFKESYLSISESIEQNNYNEQGANLMSLNKFDEFTSYFSEQETVGFNIFNDNKHVQDSLKAGYQFDWQESFGIILCNNEGEIVVQKELFKGSPNSAIVDRKVIAKELLSRDDVAYVAVYHNHPSGNTEPSKQDKQATRKLKEATELIGQQLLDHFIVGKEGVFSFAKRTYGFVHENELYTKALDSSVTHGRKQMTFDLER